MGLGLGIDILLELGLVVQSVNCKELGLRFELGLGRVGVEVMVRVVKRWGCF